MSRISIDVTPDEHQRLKAMAAIQGKSIKDYVLECTLGNGSGTDEEKALGELQSLLDERARRAEAGAISKRTVGQVFQEAYQKTGRGRNG